MRADGFTPTEQRLLAALRDGRPHRRAELHALLPDNLGRLVNLRMHLCNIRKRLRPLGQDIVCELVRRRVCYRHVMLLHACGCGRGRP